ncbi:MAG: argininosuccinate synthase [Eggerthellaceae bacterium]
MAKEKCVLAYSGGLDTSVCIKWLQDEKDLDVIAVVGEVGQEHEGLEQVKERALATGAIDCIIADMREDFAADYLSKALYANAHFENKYPLVSALSRPLISKYLVDTAHKYGAKYVAHGCTGKGNDQVRFETSIQALDPSLEIIAPVREWDMHTRDEEMDWAEAHGVPVPTTKSKPYSIDDNLWGRAIECGVLEDPMNRPPLDIYTMTTDPEKAPDEALEIEVEFKAGLPVAIDGEQMGYLDIIAKMNEIAGAHGFGRIDMIENRMIGVKSRECYEAPGALALIVAHRGLEDMCLEREVLRYKLHMEHDWATLVYNGQWFSPLKHAMDSFLKTTQQCVTGLVRLKFYKGSCTITGRKSDFSLYDYGLATYDAADTFNHEAAKGFIDLYGLSTKVWSKNRREQGVTDGE